MAKIYIIGGANIDIIASSDKELILRDSNIGKIELSYGGVGRNIGENLAYLGERVTFISCFAEDYFGKLLKLNCESLGFDLSYAKTVPGFSSSTYLAVLDHNRDMQVGINDMKIMDELKQDTIDALANVIQDDDYVFVDTNLSKELLEYATKTLKGHKVSDAISVNKVGRLFSSIGRIDILKLNRLEAEAVCGMSLDSEVKMISFLKILNEKGTKEVLVTVPEGVYIGAKGSVYKYTHDALDKDVVNVTGAGDAFLSAYTYARYKNAGIESAAIMGLAAAVLTVRDEHACAKITKNDIKKELETLHVNGGLIFG